MCLICPEGRLRLVRAPGSRQARQTARTAPCGLKEAEAESRSDVEVLAMLLIGLLIGAVARLLMPGRDPGGIIVTMLLGIAGAFVAGYLGRAIGWYQPDEAAGFIASVIGAMLLLLAYRLLLSGRRRRFG